MCGGPSWAGDGDDAAVDGDDDSLDDAAKAVNEAWVAASISPKQLSFGRCCSESGEWTLRKPAVASYYLSCYFRSARGSEVRRRLQI